MERIKLLVVDDSIFFRELVSKYIQQDAAIEIVGKAGDAYTARDMILQFEPDVMMLDLEIPRMDGIDFLKRLLPQYYIPTIIVSGNEKRSQECLDAGAVEFFLKPLTRTNSDMASFAGKLSTAVRKSYKLNHPHSNIDSIKTFPSVQAGTARGSYLLNSAESPYSAPAKNEQPHFIRDLPPTSSLKNGMANSAMKGIAEVAAKAEKFVTDLKVNSHINQSGQSAMNTSAVAAAANHTKIKRMDAVIALGASTGGTEALEQVVRVFPENTPPVVIVQHMPAGFTKLYAERLNRSCKMEVKEAEDGDRLRSGLIIIGAGDNHLRVCKDMRGYYISSKPGDKVSGHCPSVDVMFTSVAQTVGANAIGAILTGMGRDGAEGLLKMRNSGAFTIGQDKDTCVVYGMPMEAYKIGAVDVQAPLYKIAEIILNDII